MERWVRGCVAQIGCFFGLSGLPMAPFLFENWFIYIGHVFAKCIIFDEFFLEFTYRLSKTTFASQFTWQKVLIGLKKDPSRNKWFCASSLV